MVHNFVDSVLFVSLSSNADWSEGSRSCTDGIARQLHCIDTVFIIKTNRIAKGVWWVSCNSVCCHLRLYTSDFHLQLLSLLNRFIGSLQQNWKGETATVLVSVASVWF
jgi:hypothetical protein